MLLFAFHTHYFVCCAIRAQLMQQTAVTTLNYAEELTTFVTLTNHNPNEHRTTVTKALPTAPNWDWSWNRLAGRCLSRFRRSNKTTPLCFGKLVFFIAFL